METISESTNKKQYLDCLAQTAKDFNNEVIVDAMVFELTGIQMDMLQKAADLYANQQLEEKNKDIKRLKAIIKDNNSLVSDELERTKAARDFHEKESKEKDKEIEAKDVLLKYALISNDEKGKTIVSLQEALRNKEEIIVRLNDDLTREKTRLEIANSTIKRFREV